MKVLYDPVNPDEAYATSFWDLWGAPALVLFFQIDLLLISVATRPRGDDSIISLGPPQG